MAYDSISPVRFGQAAITTSASALYTTPALTRALIKEISVVNTTGVAATFDIYLVPSGGTAGTANALFYQQPLAAKATLQWNGLQVLNAGDTLQVKASASGLTVVASGGEAV